jgi:response regulator RpfG family c-di-GMP phosphodiesterase
MPSRVLFVDDDVNALSGYQRALRKDFEIEIAQGAQHGLQALTFRPAYAVVVSDMRMPLMNGVQFLTRVRELAPDTARVMLTGNADMQTAIDAVNEGCIFQFLTKPCPAARLQKALEAGVAQYNLVRSERELLEKTLQGSVKVLTEMLSLVNPLAFSRAMRVASTVRQLAAERHLRDCWKYELAAMLSQLGCLTLLPETLEAAFAGKPLPDDDRQRFEAHPTLARELIGQIPRLEEVAEMIARQREAHDPTLAKPAGTSRDVATTGARLLRLAIDLDELTTTGTTHAAALEHLQRQADQYDPFLLKALSRIESQGAGLQASHVPVWSVDVGMVIQQDIRTIGGVILLTKGQEVTSALLKRFQNFVRIGAVAGEVSVLVRAAPPEAPATDEVQELA